MPRKAITDEQRAALRHWYRSQPPSVRQRDAIDWFEHEYGHRPRQSTVSESLSARYAFLDAQDYRPASVQRHRSSQWPVLEERLYAWFLLSEERGVDATGDLLIAKARDLWTQIPGYCELEAPHFSQGWLSNFKRRHNIRTHGRPGPQPGSSPGALEERGTDSDSQTTLLQMWSR